MKFVLASNNKGKLIEMRTLMEEMNIDAEVISRREAGLTEDVEENGLTFEENSRIKAIADCKASGLPAIADDSGLCVDALGGAPGIYSARYTGNHDDSDEMRNLLVLKNMEGKENRGAAFVSAVCCVFPDGREITVRGECRGAIGFEQKGTNGFGYDSIFIPEGYDCMMAELSSEEKNAISHRGKAFRLLLEELKAVI